MPRAGYQEAKSVISMMIELEANLMMMLMIDERAGLITC